MKVKSKNNLYLLLIIVTLTLISCHNKEKSSANNSFKVDSLKNEVLNENSNNKNVLYYKVNVMSSESYYYLIDTISSKIIKELPKHNKTNLYQYDIQDSKGYISIDESFFIFKSCNPKTCCFKYTCSMYSLYLYDIKKDISLQISPNDFSCIKFELFENNEISYEGYFGKIIEIEDIRYEVGDFISKYDSIKKLKYQLK